MVETRATEVAPRLKWFFASVVRRSSQARAPSGYCFAGQRVCRAHKQGQTGHGARWANGAAGTCTNPVSTRQDPCVRDRCVLRPLEHETGEAKLASRNAVASRQCGSLGCPPSVYFACGFRSRALAPPTLATPAPLARHPGLGLQFLARNFQTVSQWTLSSVVRAMVL